jgi:hypothetical protein
LRGAEAPPCFRSGTPTTGGRRRLPEALTRLPRAHKASQQHSRAEVFPVNRSMFVNCAGACYERLISAIFNALPQAFVARSLKRWLSKPPAHEQISRSLARRTAGTELQITFKIAGIPLVNPRGGLLHKGASERLAMGCTRCLALSWSSLPRCRPPKSWEQAKG